MNDECEQQWLSDLPTRAVTKGLDPDAPMKPSGIDWLGDIPVHWDVLRLKSIVSEPLSYGANAAAEFDEPGWPRFIRITDVDELGRLRDETFRSLPPEAAQGFLLQPGDILLARSGTVGKSFIYKTSWGAACYAGYLIRARIKKEHDAHYFYWFLNSYSYWEWVRSTFIQSTIQNINADRYANLQIPHPAAKTQRRIARFLDEKTAQIDRLIAKKRELLDRLAEKRQALITRAVTKGLNPDAPMKPSDIDWIGDIPAHWEVKRLRFLLNGGTLNGLYKTKEEFDPEGIPFVQMGEAFRSPVFDGGTEDCVNATKDEIEKWRLLNGDFLVARRSIVFEGSGKSVLVYGLEGPHLFESSMIRIRPQNPQEHSKYLSFYFQSHIGRESILSVTKRVTISGIDSQQLKSIHVPIPPNSEARDIAARCETCDWNTQHIEREISASIERLVEYRFALITAAVTGQLAELR